MQKFYITTPIYYINDRPHIGHAYTTIVADVVARYFREKIGRENVYFLAGTDEHGSKIAESAAKAGQTPQQFSDQISQLFKDAWTNLGIEYSQFIRTTDQHHKDSVVEILKTLKEAITPDGQDVLYEDEYEGLYCVGCEKFLSPAELVDGKCPDHNRVPEKVKEKNWFFRLSAFLPQIKKYIESGQLNIYPEGRKKEVLGLIKQNVPDFSISRSKKAVGWGIDLPWDNNQLAYVWVDALLNYITALGYPDKENFKKFWPADIQLMALDILKFHALYWPAMLMALDIPLPKALYVHGFFTIDGKKMSKSIGNVVDPNEIVKNYGQEVSKYLILSQFSFGSESDIKIADFPAKYKADMVDGLGNLVSRVTNMIQQYMDGKIHEGSLSDSGLGELVGEKIANLRLREALLDIWQVAAESNVLIDKIKPWELSKSEDEHDKIKLTDTLTVLARNIYNIALCLKPFMPKTAEQILDLITAEQIAKPSDPLFKRLN